MRRRPSARLLVLDSAGDSFLFRFVHKTGALAGEDYWATPGGAVEDEETFEQAAIRELEEETGMRRDDVGPQVGRREFVLRLSDGERVLADERFFLVKARNEALSRDGWTADEADVMAEHRWWSPQELARTVETVWPENLLAMLDAANARQVLPG
jgi:8-oxo-dGTP pyrophosphatase MutT (NUDIX family)